MTVSYSGPVSLHSTILSFFHALGEKTFKKGQDAT